MRRSVLGMISAGIMAVSVTGRGGSAAKDGEWVKNVKIQIPVKAGGGTGVIARALANKVSAESGSTITIVNNTDGGGIVAYEKAAVGKKDGPTLTQWHLTISIKIAAGLYDKSATEDFTVIRMVVPKDRVSNVLVTSGGFSYQTPDDLVGAAEEKPGEVIFDVEAGGMIHIQTGLLAKAAGIDVRYVGAGSDTEKPTALVGNSTGVCFVNANQIKQYVESGKTRVLGAVSNSDEGGHSNVLPEAPDFTEQGVGFNFKMLNVALVGPEDMDSELASRVYDHYASATNDAEVVKTLTPVGVEMEFLNLEKGGSTLKGMQGQIDAMVEELGLKKWQK